MPQQPKVVITADSNHPPSNAVLPTSPTLTSASPPLSPSSSSIKSTSSNKSARSSRGPKGPPPLPSQIKVVEKPQMLEINPGIWDGLNPDQAKKYYPEDWDRFSKDPYSFRAPRAESYHDLSGKYSPSINISCFLSSDVRPYSSPS